MPFTGLQTGEASEPFLVRAEFKFIFPIRSMEPEIAIRCARIEIKCKNTILAA